VCGGAARQALVNRRRSQALAIELPQQVLQPAVAQTSAGGILRFDHVLGIPDDEIAGFRVRRWTRADSGIPAAVG
jgi:hypothetical protein